MGTRKIVALRAARKEGSTDTLQAAHPGRRDDQPRLPGQQGGDPQRAEIAAILEGTQHLQAPEEQSEFVNAYAMYYELVGIAETLHLIAEPDVTRWRPRSTTWPTSSSASRTGCVPWTRARIGMRPRSAWR